MVEFTQSAGQCFLNNVHSSFYLSIFIKVMLKIFKLTILTLTFSLCTTTSLEVQESEEGLTESTTSSTTTSSTTISSTTTSSTTTSSTTTSSTTTTTKKQSNYQLLDEECYIDDYSLKIEEPQRNSSSDSGLGPSTTVDNSNTKYIDNSLLPQISFNGFTTIDGNIDGFQACIRNLTSLMVYSDKYKNSYCNFVISELPLSSEFQLVKILITDDNFKAVQTRERCKPDSGQFEASRLLLRNSEDKVSLEIRADESVQLIYKSTSINDCCSNFSFDRFKYGEKILPSPGEVKFTKCSNLAMNRSEENLEVFYDLIAGDYPVDSFSVTWENVNGFGYVNKVTYSYAKAENIGITLPSPGNSTSIRSSRILKYKDVRRTVKLTIGITDTENVTKSYTCEIIVNFSKEERATTTTTSTTTTTVFVDTEAPVWSNDPITFSKVNSTYLDILWGQATDNVQVKEYKIFMNGNLVKTIPEGSTKRTTILGLNPDTLYNFEIFACDNSGNCSTENPTASKRTPESSSSGSSSSGSSSSGSSSEGNTTTTTLACLDDDEPPVLVSYSYSPDSVDVSNSPGQVEVLLTVTDNCSGVGTGFYGIDVTTTPSTGFSTASLISGTNTNGVWKAVINIPQNHFQSTFSITLYPLGDNRQNTGGFTQLGTFEVINNP